MNAMKRAGAIAAALAGTALAGLATPAAAQGVSYQRLLNADAEPHNWLMVDGNYSQHRNSGLTQINKTNVSKMQVMFAVDICGWSCTPNLFKPTGRSAGGGHGKEEAIPLVADGFLYVEDSLSKVSKIDVRSGKRGEWVWRYDPKVTQYRNRKGVALMNDKVYVCAGEPRAIALDAMTGEPVYETSLMAPPQPGNTAMAAMPQQGATAPPNVMRTAGGKNVHICGRGGVHAGNHSIDAVDADTGKLLWRRYSTPAPGEPGHQTWQNAAWMTNSSGFWSHNAFDPITNVILAGTGDAWPSYDPEYRPGDNLFAGSTMAIDVDTGAVKWYFQYIQNEAYDNDSVNNIHLWTDRNGRRVASTFARAGFWYVFDLDEGIKTGRANPQAGGTNMPNIGAFVRAHQYVDEVTWTKGIDPKTGLAVEYDPNKAHQVYLDYANNAGRRANVGKPMYHCPDWGSQSVAMSPSVLDIERRIAYTVTNDSCTTGNYVTAVRETAVPIMGAFQGNPMPAMTATAGDNIPRGFGIVGLNLETGAKRKIFKDASTVLDNESGLLGTAGGLLMSAWSNGEVAVYDKDTGTKLWNFFTGTNIAAAPITYSVDGRQYFAIVAGGGRGDVSAAPAPGAQLGGTPNLWVFGLRE